MSLRYVCWSPETISSIPAGSVSGIDSVSIAGSSSTGRMMVSWIKSLIGWSRSMADRSDIPKFRSASTLSICMRVETMVFIVVIICFSSPGGAAASSADLADVKYVFTRRLSSPAKSGIRPISKFGRYDVFMYEEMSILGKMSRPIWSSCSVSESTSESDSWSDTSIIAGFGAKASADVTARYDANSQISFLMLAMDPPNGVQVPSGELRALIDKTAGYVLKNGQTFEDRLRKDAASAEKFHFIFSDDKHYQYYLWKLGRLEAAEAPNGAEKAQEKMRRDSGVAMPPDLKFVVDLPQISGLDLNVIKATALFTAVNGREWARKLQEHEASRGHKAQFDFLNRKSTLYGLFETFVGQYEKTIDFLNANDTKPDLLHDSYARALHDKQAKVKHDERKQQVKQRNTEYAAIDWQDFALVGKIEFTPVDEVTELAVPLSRDDLVYRSLEAKTKELDFVTAPPSEQKTTTASEARDSETPEPAAKMPKGIKIKAAGESRLKKKSKERFIKCPLTGQLVPEAKFDDHLRILLRDPRYNEQKENHLRKNFKYASNLTTEEVYENMKRLARKRTAIEEEEPEHKRVMLGPSGPTQ